MNIRNMRLSDFDVVDGLMQQLHALHVQERPDVFTAMEHPYTYDMFERMINDEEKITILVEVGDEVVGICVVAMRNMSGMVTMKTAYMDDLIIDERYRGMGYARALFHEAEAIAKEKGAERLDLMVWGFNESALHFYKKLGMTPQRYIFEKRL